MQNILASAIDAAQVAGDILLEYYQADYNIRDKGFNNPVTTADYACNHYLEERLRDSYPDYGWLSEETADTASRLSKDRVWVVDPLDGTKEFIEGVPQFVVSIALVEQARPVLGVLHNPATKETFSAVSGNGAALNGIPIRVSKVERLEEATILNSRTETRHGLWKRYKPHFLRLIPTGSVAFKLGLTAAGQADMFATLRPKNEWDICAGDIILREAGAELRDLKGEMRAYNRRDTKIKPGLVAGNPTIVKAFLELYRTLRKGSKTD